MATDFAKDVTTESRNLFKEFWDWRLSESPEFATNIGLDLYADQLESYSLEAIQKRKKRCEEFLLKAEKLFHQIDPSSDDVIRDNLEIFIEELNTYLRGLSLDGYFCPINFLEGVQVEFEWITSNMKLKTTEDYEKLLLRYQAFSKQADEIISLMREGIRRKMVNHQVSMGGVLDQFKLLQTPDCEKSAFYKPFLSLNDIPEAKRERLRVKAKSVIQNVLLPAFKHLGDFIENEYMVSLRPDIAATSLPNGQKFYEECLKFHLSLDMTPEEVHQIGLQEVDRIKKEMQDVRNRLGIKMSAEEFSEFLRTSPQFFFTDEETVLAAYRDIVENHINPKLGKIFKSIPKINLLIKRMPESLEGGPFAFYISGTPDGSRPGVFYVNLSNLKRRPRYEMMSLTLHEGVPGHHLQISHVLELPNIPDFRKFREERKYSTAPSRFPFYAAYVEGWGLYSEYLGYELGLYDDLYYLYGHLCDELFRACRLVVDTGIHAFGWSRQQAIDYMTKTIATNKNIEKEVDRYITLPGHACTYKIGQLKIKELRKLAEEKLGDKFDVKEFHEVILNNQGPLKLLEKQVNRYIERVRQ